MGGVAAKCSDANIEKGSGAPKPLDASSSEDEDGEDEGDEDSEEEEDGDDDLRAQAEAALSEVLKRGKTGTFKEVIDHATAVGIAEDKIAKAEAALEQHKATRKREAFEAELRDFLESDECEDLVACEEKEQQGIKFGVSDKGLAALREKIEDLNLRKDLAEEEVAQAKLFLEVYCRRFVKSAVKGRSTVWIDVASGKKQRVAMTLDLTLHNITIVKTSGDTSTLATCRLDQASGMRAVDTEELADAVGQLSEAELEGAVVITGGSTPWLCVEEDTTKADEVLVGLLLLGRGTSDAPPMKSTASSSKKAGKKMASKKAAEPEPAEDPGEAPISPRGGADSSANSARAKNQKKDKREKKDKKDKKAKAAEDEEDGDD